MTLYYTNWCLFTVCDGWFSVSIISSERIKNRKIILVNREDLKCILSIYFYKLTVLLFQLYLIFSTQKEVVSSKLPLSLLLLLKYWN